MYTSHAATSGPSQSVSYPLVGVLLLLSASTQAQDAAPDPASAEAFRVTPRISVTQTLSDNIRLATTATQSDQVTRISPGVRVVSQGGRLQGSFDYALEQLTYAQNTSADSHRHALQANATLEAVADWAFIDFNGSVSQQAVSAFGAQSSDSVAIDANRTEVSSYRVSPYLRGRIGNLVDYEARYSRTDTKSDSIASDVTTQDSLVKLSGASAFKNLDWAADVSQQKVDYSAGRATESQHLNLALSYAITPQLRVSAFGGRETNNFTTLDKEAHATSGIGLDWLPSEITRFQASRSQHAFGDTHAVSLAHRTPKTAWRFSDSRNVSVTPSQSGLVGQGAVFDILFDQFAAVEPNPTTRAQLVNAYLLANGISPGAVVVSSYLTSAVALQRRQDVSLALMGARDTVTFVASRTRSSRLDSVSVGADDLSSSQVMFQRGLSINYAHRLTPDYALGVQLSQQKTSADQSLQDTSLHSFKVSLTGRLGKNSTGMVSVVRVVSGGGASPYAENTVTVNLVVQF